MTLDLGRHFSNRQAIRETAYSDGMIDLQRGDGLFAPPRALTVFALVTTAFVGGATLRIEAQSQDWPHSGPHAGFDFATDVMRVEDLKDGRDIRLLLGTRKALRRFLRLRYLVDGRFERGALSAYLQS